MAGKTLACNLQAGACTGGVPRRRELTRRRQPRCSVDNSNGAAPNRGVVILPGLGNAGGDYAALEQRLRARGLSTATVPVQRVDWLRNAAGVVDPNYWRGTLNPRPTVDWYLNLLNDTVDALKRETDGAPISLLAHSAGGWLARIYLLGFGTAGIDRLVSLGSPHNPPPKGVIDQTRGILDHVADKSPGNYHSEIAYVTIAGKYIKGAELGGPGTWPQRFAGLGYKQVCGQAEVWGDGIVPLPTAHLDGAHQVTLDGVYHSPLGSSEAMDSAAIGNSAAAIGNATVVGNGNGNGNGNGEAGKAARVWYGSDGVLEQWAHLLGCEEGEIADGEVEVGGLVGQMVETAAQTAV